MASSLTLEQAKTFIEKMGELYDVHHFTAAEAERVLVLAKASKALDNAVTEKLTGLGLPVSPESVKELGNNEEPLDCIARLPTLIDFLNLHEVKTLRPEYLMGTWFNMQGRPFKLNMEFDWVNRMEGGRCTLPDVPMSVFFFASTGDHIWDFISEVHVHRTAMKEFSVPRNGWIEAPGNSDWTYEQKDSPLDFIERMTKVSGGRTIVQLFGGTGGWATFEQVSNCEVTIAAAMQLFKFSDPLYCARSDGKVVIKLVAKACRATLNVMSKFPSGRSLVTQHDKFPSCIP